MRITKKCSLEEEVERFTHVLQREISFFSAKKARSIFVQCLGYDSFEKLLSEFPIMLNEKTQIKSSPLSNNGFFCDFRCTASKTSYFPFLLDPVKESNKDVLKKLKKCFSGLYNVRNEHLEIVGEKAGYHVANFILEGDVSGAAELLRMISSLSDYRRKNAIITQAVNRLKLSHEKDSNLTVFFSLLPS